MSSIPLDDHQSTRAIQNVSFLESQDDTKPRQQDRRRATAWSADKILQRLIVDFPDDEPVRIATTPATRHCSLTAAVL